jgi:hypothetical protein
MKDNLINNIAPAGTDLFSGFGSFLNDLSEHDEAVIAGGGSNSRSKSGRRRRRRRPRRRVARRRGSRT